MAEPLPVVFPVGVFIQDELDARGWSISDIAFRMGGDYNVTKLAIEMTIALADDATIFLGGAMAEQLARAFGTSASLWIRLDEQFRAWRYANPPPPRKAPMPKKKDHNPGGYIGEALRNATAPRRPFFGGKFKQPGGGRVRGHKVGMNKTEAAYADHLEQRRASGEITAWAFERLTVKLAPGSHWRPDFLVQFPDNTVEIHDTKGYVEREGLTKLKVAATLVPFRIVVVKRKAKKDGGGWSFEAIGDEPGAVVEVREIK